MQLMYSLFCSPKKDANQELCLWQIISYLVKAL